MLKFWLLIVAMTLAYVAFGRKVVKCLVKSVKQLLEKLHQLWQAGTGEVTAGAAKLNPVNGFVADSTAPTPDTSVVNHLSEMWK